jgi:beta-glucanase (GH16 family)
MKSLSIPGAVAAVAVAAALLSPVSAPADVGGPIRTVAAASDECGELLPKAGGGTWECTFVDNFTGNRIDTDKWLVGATSWTGFHTGSTCMVDSHRNVAVRGGALRLTTRRERPFTCASAAVDFQTRYTGGHVATRGRFAQAYGRFEVRAQYPKSRKPGVHGGFWMYPAEHTYGPWPHSGEIDVAEWWSELPHHVVPSLHYPGRDFFADSGWSCTIQDVSAWNTYAMEWTPQEMRFFQNGKECWRRSWEPDSPLVAPQPFDQPFNLVLTMGVGQQSGSNAVSEETDLPAEYAIDYVKAWR